MTTPTRPAPPTPGADLREQWHEALRSALRRQGLPDDSDPEAALTTTIEDGIVLRPLYTAQDVAWPVDGGAAHPPGWDVCTGYADPDADRVNEQALADLVGGASSLWLTVGSHGTTPCDLPRVLDGVLLDLVEVVLDAGAESVSAATELLTLAQRTGVDPGRLRGSLGGDPVAARARGAVVDGSTVAELADLARGTGLVPVTVDGTVFNDAGGSDADEVGLVTAAAVTSLRMLADAGVTDPFSAIAFRFTVGADQFTSIAKLRAARRVWEAVARECGVAGVIQRQHAVTARTMLSRRDPHVNILRTTVAAFAAAVGGAQAITVTPFDEATGSSTGLARRIARNTQAILHDESSLARVADPAAGSWYVESLTQRLAEVAWDKFRTVERAGGALTALDSGVVPDLLRGSRAARASAIAQRRTPIVGVSIYPARIDSPAAGPTPHSSAPAGGLPVVRWAEPFEALRDRLEAAASPPDPVAVVVEAGRALSRGADQAIELFALAGIPTVLVEDAEHSGATGGVVCLCAETPLTAEVAAMAADAARADGATWVVAVQPPDPAVAAAGVDDFLGAGCDVPAALGRVLDRMGVR